MIVSLPHSGATHFSVLSLIPSTPKMGSGRSSIRSSLHLPHQLQAGRALCGGSLGTAPFIARGTSIVILCPSRTLTSCKPVEFWTQLKAASPGSRGAHTRCLNVQRLPGAAVATARYLLGGTFHRSAAGKALVVAADSEGQQTKAQAGGRCQQEAAHGRFGVGGNDSSDNLVVVRGDSLWNIARARHGNGFRHTLIYGALMATSRPSSESCAR